MLKKKRYLLIGLRVILLAISFTLLPYSSKAYVSKAFDEKNITIKGYITDYATGETLISAGVSTQLLSKNTGRLSQNTEQISQKNNLGETQGTVTNNFGFYTITIPAGKVKLTYSYIGYANQVLEGNFLRDTTINIKLRDDLKLKEAVVTAHQDAGINSSYSGSLEIPVSSISKTPALFGEADVMKSVQLVPGVQAGMEGTSGVYIRGGGKDENLLMLDGVSIYNVDHMLGLFSVFTPEAVKKVTLYKGSFPARYGGKTAGIIDVRTNDGNLKETKGSVSVGLLASKVHVEGPIKKDKTSYSLSARMMHTLLADKFLDLLKEKTNYYFYDFNGKIVHKFNDNNKLYFSVYHGKDKLAAKIKDNYSWNNSPSNNENIEAVHEKYFNKINLNWGNSIAALRWNHLFGNKIFSNTTIAYNHYNMNISSYSNEKTIRGQNEENNDQFKVNYNSGIRDLSARIDFDYQPKPNHLIKFGSEYVFHTFLPETQKIKIKEAEEGKTLTDTLYKSQNAGNLYGHEIGLYGEYDITLWNRLTLDPGFRLTIFNTDGKTYVSPEPRISAKFDFGKGISAKAAYSATSQYVHLLSDSQFSMPTDLWVPITKDVKPIFANQYSIGVYYTGLPKWEFSAEAYYKTMKNELEYKEGMSAIGSSMNWFDKVAMGKGTAKGFEFMARKTAGKLSGMIGYSLSWSDRQFKKGEINNGKKFPFLYDRRHSITSNVNYKFNNRYDIAATWTFATGNPITIAERKTLMMEEHGECNFVPARNNFRLPASHRLSIGFNMHKKKKHGERIWNISLYNAYNQMNPNLVYTNTKDKTITRYDDEGIRYTETVKKIQIKKITLLPILPSFTYTFKF